MNWRDLKVGDRLIWFPIESSTNKEEKEYEAIVQNVFEDHVIAISIDHFILWIDDDTPNDMEVMVDGRRVRYGYVSRDNGHLEPIC